MCFGLLCQNQLAIDAWIYVWNSILIHWSSCLCLCQYHPVFITMALRYRLKLGIVMPPALDFLLGIILAILVMSFVFPYVFHNCFFYFCAECHLTFDRDCIEHIDCFFSVAIFTILILPIHEHGRSFHLLMSSSISLFSGL
jgi:hypothetical protein